MSGKWQIICIIWIICGAVAILTNVPSLMLLPAIGTLIAAFYKYTIKLLSVFHQFIWRANKRRRLINIGVKNGKR